MKTINNYNNRLYNYTIVNIVNAMSEDLGHKQILIFSAKNMYN